MTHSIRLKSYKHIIWDWNGTLLDDAWLCVEIINSLLRLHRKPEVDLASYRRVFDFPIENYYKKLGFDFSTEPFETTAVKFIEIYYRRVGECSLQPFAEKALQAVKGLNIPQSLLSASEHASLKSVVQGFNIEDYFLKIQGIEDHYAQGKIQLGKRLVREIAMEPDEILFIGDTVHDHDVAKAIGADCLLIPGGHHTKEKLLPVHTAVMDSLQEVMESLNGNS